ncbi:MAG: hypothetical protein K9M13_02065 [Simkaniaceae bacterium]|nr:hypothetical protein [Simkaniaceae bacterium]
MRIFDWFKRRKYKKAMITTMGHMQNYLQYLNEEIQTCESFSDVQIIRKSKESVEGAISVMILVGDFYGINFYVQKTNGELYVDWDEMPDD